MDLFRSTDIKNAANSMIRDFGPRAADEAAANAVRARQRGRHTAESTWNKIAAEIRRILAEQETGC